MAINFNVTPYNDDYDINDGYLKILFKPGAAIQARELTQMQSILQQQVSNLSDHFFKEGAMVVPGQSAIDTKANYVKIDVNTENSYINAADFVGRTIVGQETGAKALVVHAESKTGTTDADDPDTIFVKYVTGAEIVDGELTYNFQDGQSVEFLPDEILLTEPVENESDYSCVVRDASESPTGIGSIAFIERGIYYVQGFLTLVKSQKIVLDKYYNKPSYKIGLEISEEVVTSNDDFTLLDNATGSPNFNAPGADRYQTTLIFTKKSLDTDDTSNFIQLIQINNGVIESKVETTAYSYLEDTLARRTFDESGNYTVYPFKLDIRNMLNDGTNRGVYRMSDFAFETEVRAKNEAITRFSDSDGMVDLNLVEGLAHTIGPLERETYPDQDLDETGTLYYPGRTHEDLVNALEERLAIGVEAGKAYVRGYEIETLGTTFVDYLKSRDNIQRNNQYLSVELGNYLYVTDVLSLPKINQEVKLVNMLRDGENHIGVRPDWTTDIYTYNEEADFDGSGNTLGIDVVGTAKVKYIEHYKYSNNNDWRTATVSGDNPDQTAIYKLYLYDIEFEDNPVTSKKYNINDVRSVSTFDYVGTVGLDAVPDFGANVLFEYYMVENLSEIGYKSVLYSLYGDSDVRGVVYDVNSATSSVLVKPLGGGNLTAYSTYLPNTLFANNDILGEIEYKTNGNASNPFDGNAFFDILNNSCRTLDRKLLHDTSGGNIVSTGAQYVKTIRYVDEESGKEHVDTSYTVQREYNLPVIQDTGTNTASITVSLPPGANEVFGSFNPKYYYIYTEHNQNSGTLGEIQGIEANDVTLSLDAKSLKITGLDIVTVGQSVRLVLPVIKTESVEKTKTLVSNTVITPYSLIDAAGVDTGDDFSLDILSLRVDGVTGELPRVFQDGEGYDLSLAEMQLRHSDIKELIAIYDTCNMSNTEYRVNLGGETKTIDNMTAAELKFAHTAFKYYETYGADPFTTVVDGAPFISEITEYISTNGDTPPPMDAGGPVKIENVTDRYTLDDGQRNGFYDIGSVSLKKGQVVCAGRPIIVYSYFNHQNGDYASVDSYINIDYGEIGSYKGQNLTDVLDFRPASTFAQYTTSSGHSALTGYGQVVTTGEYPLDGSYVIADYRVYLPRKDKLYISKSGDFEVKYGSSSLTSKFPEDPDDGMVIYKMTSEPYTAGPKAVISEMIDNKRYTMRDIGKLEKRISNLEYYTNLSLLEKQTKDMSITDAEGFDRFKNGFVVEPFNGHNIGDVFDLDYNCSIDSAKGVLRPRFDEKFTNMKFSPKDSENFSNKNGVLFLPYEEMVFINQPKSSKTVNVNPFAIFSFRGTISLIPSQDEWKDVDRRPDVTINREGQFDNIQFLADQMGILGTEWNSWQTTWTGEEVTDTTSNNWVQRGSGIRQMRTDTSTIEITTDQTRTGTRTELVPKVTTESLGDRVINTEIVPYIRSRAIYFHGQRMKPNTKVYAFFDDISVDHHCESAQVITVDGMAQDAGNFVDENEQKFIAESGNIVLRGGTSGHEVRIYGLEYVDVNTIKFFVVDNMDNADFINDEPTFIVDDSGNSMRLGDFRSKSGGESQTLKTDEYGEVRGIFTIPNTDTERFRTGDRVFRLVDQSNGSTEDSDTNAQTVYTASGIIETREETILSTKTAEFVQRDVSQTRTVTSTTTRSTDTALTGWYDPLAETIMIEQKGGCYISAVEIFFSTKDSAIPVTVQLRDTVNGYPGQRILPGGEKSLKPSRVSVSDDGSVGTRFVFKQPVYVQDSTEYCIVVLADTQGYRCHVARLGEESLDGTGTISQQPYAGVFFKSQNASTWTADQMEDLKFRVYRAKFESDKKAVLHFANTDFDITGNDQSNTFLLPGSIETVANSSEVTFHVRNHGAISSTFYDSHNYVEIAGLNSQAFFGGDQSSGITGAELNGVHKVIHTSLDTFTIDVSNTKFVYNNTTKTYDGVSGIVKNAATSGRFDPAPEDSNVPAYINSNTKFDLMCPIVQNVQLPGTSIKYEYKSTSGVSQDSALTPGIKDSAWYPFNPSDNTYFESPRGIYSKYNEFVDNKGSGIDKKSLQYRITMSSSSDNLSPQVDTERCSAMLISNRTNSPEWNVVTDPVTGIDSDVGVSNQTLGYVSGGFLSERLAGGGSVDATYITREISLQQASKSLKIVLTATRPTDTDIDLYYKTKNSDSQDYHKLTYTPIDRPAGYDTNQGETREWEYDVQDLDDFISFGIKIVMRSKNSCYIPEVSDLRIIALAT